MIDKWPGGAAQPNLGVQDLERFIIPIPPTVEEQTVIAEIAALQAKLAKARHVK